MFHFGYQDRVTKNQYIESDTLESDKANKQNKNSLNFVYMNVNLDRPHFTKYVELL
jgi:hypothetical protein